MTVAPSGSPAYTVSASLDRQCVEVLIGTRHFPHKAIERRGEPTVFTYIHTHTHTHTHTPLALPAHTRLELTSSTLLVLSSPTRHRAVSHTRSSHTCTDNHTTRTCRRRTSCPGGGHSPPPSAPSVRPTPPPSPSCTSAAPSTLGHPHPPPSPQIHPQPPEST